MIYVLTSAKYFDLVNNLRDFGRSTLDEMRQHIQLLRAASSPLADILETGTSGQQGKEQSPVDNASESEEEIPTWVKKGRRVFALTQNSWEDDTSELGEELPTWGKKGKRLSSLTQHEKDELLEARRITAARAGNCQEADHRMDRRCEAILRALGNEEQQLTRTKEMIRLANRRYIAKLHLPGNEQRLQRHKELLRRNDRRYRARMKKKREMSKQKGNDKRRRTQ